jgi:hypothetical protein
MSEITYFAELPFGRTEGGDFPAEAAIEVRSAVEAKAMAARMKGPDHGAVAFQQERRSAARRMARRQSMFRQTPSFLVMCNSSTQQVNVSSLVFEFEVPAARMPSR